MTARKPLPNHLVARGFSVDIARRGGVPNHRLHARDLSSPYWGLRAPSGMDLSLLHRCQLLGLGLPAHAFFSGATAAALLGMPVPLRYLQPDAPLEVSVPGSARAIRRNGARGRRLQIAAADVEALDGIRLTSPSRTWCDLAPGLTLPELVAAGDHLIFHERPLVTPAQLADAVAAHPGRRWRSKLRRALELLDERSESPRESMLRVILVTHDFPAPRANVSLYDESGHFVARVDLLFEDYREVLEYQGDHHRTDVRQWRRDLTRKAEVESLGFHVTEVTADDLVDVASLLRRLERNLRRRGWSGRATRDP